MIEQQASVNHITSYPSPERSIMLSASILARLRTLYSRAETRNEVLQEIQRTVEASQAALREYVSDVLDMHDMPFAQNDRFTIDWAVGKITLEAGGRD